MKKILILAVLAITFATAALAAGPTLPRDFEGQKLNAPSWDATLSQAILTTASQNIPISGRLWYEFQPAADCEARLMNTTTKATWPQFTIKANTAFRGSNPALSTSAKSAFLNISGCTGDFRAQ